MLLRRIPKSTPLRPRVHDFRGLPADDIEVIMAAP
jgi:hypothetical protein